MTSRRLTDGVAQSAGRLGRIEPAAARLNASDWDRMGRSDVCPGGGQQAAHARTQSYLG